MKTGHRVVVSAIADSPAAALERYMTLEPMEPPDTSKLGRRDVVVAIHSASVNWVDLLMASGLYQHAAKPPYCPGLEYAGVVAWKGEDVGDQLSVGDRVLSDGLSTGPRSLGDYQGYGGYASYAVAPADAVHRVPSALSFDEACNLLGSYETAYHCLVTRGRLQPGETVLVHGASGATGLAAVHVAKLLGAVVIATGRSPAKLAIVKEQGADHVVALGTGRLRDEIRPLTGGQGVDVVYDGVGGDLSIESLRCVKFGARFLVVGWASTPFAKGTPNVLPTNLIMMKGLSVLGCPTVIATVNEPSLRAPRLRQILEWAESGKLRPLVSRSYPLSSFKEALSAKWNGEIVGGCVLRP